MMVASSVVTIAVGEAVGDMTSRERFHLSIRVVVVPVR